MGFNVGGPAFSVTALRCSVGTGGCATRPAGSDMLAIPWPKARGNLPRPARLRRQQGAHPAAPSALFLPACGAATLLVLVARSAVRVHAVSCKTQGWVSAGHSLRVIPRAWLCLAEPSWCSSLRRRNAQRPPKYVSGTKGWGGVRPGALLAPSSAAARWACAQHMLRQLTRCPCLNGAPEGRAVSWAAPPRREQRRGVTPKA